MAGFYGVAAIRLEATGKLSDESSLAKYAATRARAELIAGSLEKTKDELTEYFALHYDNGLLDWGKSSNRNKNSVQVFYYEGFETLSENDKTAKQKLRDPEARQMAFSIAISVFYDKIFTPDFQFSKNARSYFFKIFLFKCLTELDKLNTDKVSLTDKDLEIPLPPPTGNRQRGSKPLDLGEKNAS